MLMVSKVNGVQAPYLNTLETRLVGPSAPIQLWSTNSMRRKVLAAELVLADVGEEECSS